MTAARARLSNRRDSVLETLVVDGKEFIVGMSFDAHDQLKEMFLTGPKEGSDMAALLSDATVAISVALQHGVPAAAMAKSMGRRPNVAMKPGSLEQLGVSTEPASPIGAALDLLCRLEPRVACKGANEYDHT